MHQALALGGRERLDARALDLGDLEHGRDELLLAAQDLGLLDLDLLLLLDLLRRARTRRRPAAA